MLSVPAGEKEPPGEGGSALVSGVDRDDAGRLTGRARVG